MFSPLCANVGMYSGGWGAHLRNVNVITTGVFDIIFLMALVIPGTISKWQPGQEARRGAGSRGGGPGAARGVMTLGGPISFNKTKERPTPAQASRSSVTLHSALRQTPTTIITTEKQSNTTRSLFSYLYTLK